MQETIEKVIIIGGGPAGHTAAIYTARAWLSPLLFEGFMAEGIAPWGLLTTTGKIENFPGFEEGIFWVQLMQKMKQQSLSLGARILTQTVTKVDFTEKPFKIFTEKETFLTESVIIATGAKPKTLNLPWEKRFWQRGISVCAVCDGRSPLFKDKTVVILWNGDIAAEEALFMSNFAQKVSIFFEEEKFSATERLQQKINGKQNIALYPQKKVLSFDGDKVLQSLVYQDLLTQKEENFDCSGVFYALWTVPNTSLFSSVLAIDEEGYAKISKKWATSIEGVFAWGEVCDPIYQQAITAASWWCQAAFWAIEYLQ